MTELKKLLLVDASWLIYRAFHAFPPFTRKDGSPNGAVFGFFSLLRALLKRTNPDFCLIALDSKGGSHRKEIFPDYKAHRRQMPDLLRPQLSEILDLLSFTGLTAYGSVGFEADDIIAGAAQHFKHEPLEIIIASGDKDMAQLIDCANVRLLQDKDQPLMDRDAVFSKYGVYPEQITDYLGLVGDAADNLPGVSGIGKKTAQQLLAHFSDLDALYADLDVIDRLTIRGKERIKNRLIEEKETAHLSRQLAVLNTNMNIPFSLSDLLILPPQFSKLIERYRFYELNSFVKEAQQSMFGGRQFARTCEANTDASEMEKAHLQTIEYKQLEPTQFLSMILNNPSPISLVSLSKTKLCFLVFSKNIFSVIDADIISSPLFDQIRIHPKILKVSSPIRDAMQQLGSFTPVWDPAAAFWILKPHLKAQSWEEICHQCLCDHNLFNAQVLDSHKSIEIARALNEAKQLLDVYQALFQRLAEEQPKLLDVLQRIEFPLVDVLLHMESNGILIDVPRLKTLNQSLHKEIVNLEYHIFMLSGEEFNIASSQQVGRILFDILKLPSHLKTKKGARSTREEVLKQLATQYPIVQLLLRHRELSKLRSTYAQGLLRSVNPETHRIHTCYQQWITSTGRLSSVRPNLQNIPIKTENGREIRQCFISATDFKLFCADYSQVELRVLAHFSNDSGLIQSFKNHEDIHSTMASQLFMVPVECVTTEQRRQAKTITFGLIYGMSAFGLAKELNIGHKQAQTYLDQYFLKYPGVALYLQKTKEHALEQGWVETLMGRRWILPEAKSLRISSREAFFRSAINAPIQGTAAELIKIAMIRLDRWIRSLGPACGISMLLQVHDELIFEIKSDLIDAYKDRIIFEMENAMDLTVPLVVNCKAAENWVQAH